MPILVHSSQSHRDQASRPVKAFLVRHLGTVLEGVPLSELGADGVDTPTRANVAMFAGAIFIPGGTTNDGAAITRQTLTRSPSRLLRPSWESGPQWSPRC